MHGSCRVGTSCERFAGFELSLSRTFELTFQKNTKQTSQVLRAIVDLRSGIPNLGPHQHHLEVAIRRLDVNLDTKGSVTISSRD